MIPDHEKIETIVLTYLRGGQITEGRFGKLIWLAAESSSRFDYRVEVRDGPCVLIKCLQAGWMVEFKGCAGLDRDLIEAARRALEAGRGTCATRGYPVGAHHD